MYQVSYEGLIQNCVTLDYKFKFFHRFGGSVIWDVSFHLRSIVRFQKFGHLSKVNNSKLSYLEIKNVCGPQKCQKVPKSATFCKFQNSKTLDRLEKKLHFWLYYT